MGKITGEFFIFSPSHDFYPFIENANVTWNRSGNPPHILKEVIGFFETDVDSDGRRTAWRLNRFCRSVVKVVGNQFRVTDQPGHRSDRNTSSEGKFCRYFENLLDPGTDWIVGITGNNRRLKRTQFLAQTGPTYFR